MTDQTIVLESSFEAVTTAHVTDRTVVLTRSGLLPAVIVLDADTVALLAKLAGYGVAAPGTPQAALLALLEDATADDVEMVLFFARWLLGHPTRTGGGS